MPSNINGTFSWTNYLEEKASSAPQTAFKEHMGYMDPIQNKFKKGSTMKINNPGSDLPTIGIVEKTSGPRLYVRLAGTSYTLWTLVNQDIEPLEEHSEIPRPLGCKLPVKQWATFVNKKISERASKECFMREPPSPPRNQFSVGQKLEAVDIANPNLICCAAVKKVNEDDILIGFDRWGSDFD